jgi:glutathione reductase (NADPH)
VEVNGELYTAPHIVIATGGRPTIPKIPGAGNTARLCDFDNLEYGINSDYFFDDMEDLPKKVAVVGAGYIAVELAGVLQSLGIGFATKTDIPRKRDSHVY